MKASLVTDYLSQQVGELSKAVTANAAQCETSFKAIDGEFHRLIDHVNEQISIVGRAEDEKAKYIDDIYEIIDEHGDLLAGLRADLEAVKQSTAEGLNALTSTMNRIESALSNQALTPWQEEGPKKRRKANG